MNDMVWRLALRRIRRTWVNNALLCLLFTFIITVLLIYTFSDQTKATQTGTLMWDRIPPAHWLIETPTPEPVMHFDTPSHIPLLLSCAWQDATVSSSIGSLQCILMDDRSALGKTAPPQSIIVHNSMATRFGLTVGDKIIVIDEDKPLEVTVYGVYNGPDETMNYDFGDKPLLFLSSTKDLNFFLYKDRNPDKSWIAFDALTTVFPNAAITTIHRDPNLGALAAQMSADLAMRLKMTLIFFLGVVFLMSRVMNFLDNRRVLAVLKAIGLGPAGVTNYILVDALVAPLMGVAAGWVLGCAIVKGTQGIEHLALATVFGAIGSIVPAVVISIWFPVRLAKQASTNELALERVIPLVHERISGASRRYPQLDSYVAKGTHVIKLDMTVAPTDRFVFRRFGDSVNQGEVLARTISWWGLKVTDYIAPITGTITYYQPELGLMGVGG